MSRNLSARRIAKKNARKKNAPLRTDWRAVDEILEEIFARGNVVSFGSSEGSGNVYRPAPIGAKKNFFP
jgi:hypothetical protein